MKEISRQELEAQLIKYGQSHLLQFLDLLPQDDQNNLIKEINSIHYDSIQGIFKQALKDLEAAKKLLDSSMEPILVDDLGSSRHTTSKSLMDYNNIGLSNIREGKVAVILLAGGVGTRLGVNYPKGMYDVGLLSKKSLFQLQAERILKLNELSQNYDSNGLSDVNKDVNNILWCIMTSDNTIEQTNNYFAENNYFGLDSDSVIFFKQHSIPCLDMEGKIILESPNKVSLSPEGNGGIYRALLTSGVLSQLLDKGIKYIHVYGVDNVLVKVADPVFMGFCIKKKAECGVKVIEKIDPNEAVGVVCKVEGRYQVVEYSEITYDTAHKTNSEGQLLYNAGNIVNHFYSIEFLQHVCKYHEDLIYHVAKKKIAHVNSKGETISPDKPNGVKMEKFIFDVFPLAKKFAVWQVDRDEEFSPLKNADTAKDNNAKTCRTSLYTLHQKYVTQAGGLFNLSESNEHACEISPLVSYGGEGLEGIVKGKIYDYPFLLCREQDDIPSIINENLPKDMSEEGDLISFQQSCALVHN